MMLQGFYENDRFSVLQGTDFANASSAHFRYWLPLRMRARV